MLVGRHYEQASLWWPKELWEDPKENVLPRKDGTSHRPNQCSPPQPRERDVWQCEGSNPRIVKRVRVGKEERHIFSINSGVWGSILQLTLRHQRVHVMAHNHLVHPASCACGKSELDLFSVPPTQTAIESSQWVEYRPITTLSDSSPIEFVITGSGEEYVDLSESYLQVTAKILKPNGGDLVQTKGSDGMVTGDDADVGPVNLWLHSLFSQVDVSLNERLVTPSMNTYPYRAYLETLLSYGPAAKESYLTAAMWYKDTAKHMEDHQLNKGFKSGAWVASKSSWSADLTWTCVSRIAWCWTE